MTANATPIVKRLGLAIVTVSLLGACSAADRIANIGQAPELTPIENPLAREDYTPVRMPMPAPQVPEPQAASLWQPGSRAFFRDQRAGAVGDILTVMINIDDQATLSNQSSRSRSSAEDSDIPAFFGFQAQLDNWLPDEINPDALVQFGSDGSHAGTGTITRDEEIELQLAVVVTDVLPNGNLVIFGRQEVRVNFEARDLHIAGVIRPEDITAANTISYEKIAEARISYGGRGQITDVQQPRYGQQLYDIVFPF